MSKYSIILPVKNGGNYIKECIGSILSQTHKDFNLIILENKSTDGTAEWIQTIKDGRVNIYPANEPLNIADNWHRILSIEKKNS